MRHYASRSIQSAERTIYCSLYPAESNLGKTYPGHLWGLCFPDSCGFFPCPQEMPSSHGRHYSKNTGNSALRKMERSLQSTRTEWSSTLKERWGHIKEDWGKRGDNPLLEWQAADCTGMAEESSPMAPLISVLGKGSFVWLHLPCLFLPETKKGLFSVCVVPSSKGSDWIWWEVGSSSNAVNAPSLGKKNQTIRSWGDVRKRNQKT